MTACKDNEKKQKPKKAKKSKILRVILWIIGTPLALALLTVLVVFILLYGRIATMASAGQVSHNIYKVHYQQDYKLDKALAAGIETEEDLLSFINEELYFGMGFDANLDKYACSAFISKTDGGKYLTGRSFGLGGTDKLAVYATPRNGYRSLSMVSLDMLGVGGKNGIETLSLYGRLAMLAAPYICVDGVNEKGVFAALLDLDSGEVHDRTDRPELFSTMAVRLILDRAASVDEAVELLRQYDIHTGHGYTQHIFITDATGDAAAVEWVRSTNVGKEQRAEMKVTRSQYCTNFWLYKGADSEYCERFQTMREHLDGKNEITHGEAKNILVQVYQDIDDELFTDWSVIYYQTDFTMEVAANREFNAFYALSPEDF